MFIGDFKVNKGRISIGRDEDGIGIGISKEDKDNRYTDIDLSISNREAKILCGLLWQAIEWHIDDDGR